jgi:uncharacterized protein YdeI (YjbR/CyaY-like superfamily)
MAKKHTGLATVSYNDAVEEALCFGWIDTTLNPIDAQFYKQLFTPRKPRSTWAATNKARVERLIAQNLMTAAGLAAIETAKANGSWSSIDHVEAGEVPDDLQRAIAGSAVTRRAWAALRPGLRKQFLFRMSSAKRQNTRDARIAAILQWLKNAGAVIAAKGTAPASAIQKTDGRAGGPARKTPATARRRRR